MRIAVMYKLDYRGRIVEQQLCEYHSCHWGNLCSLGYITAEVLETPKQHLQSAS